MIEMTARLSRPFVSHQVGARMGVSRTGQRNVYSRPRYLRFISDLREQFAYDGEPYAEPVRVDMLLAFPVTKKHGERVMGRVPDVENVAKSVNDALEGIAFDNDARVAELRVRKVEVMPSGKWAVRVRVQPAAALTDDDRIGEPK